MKVSVVIPTKDRLNEINSLFKCLSDQTRKPDEIILIDSSVGRHDYEIPGNLNIILKHSEASVCIQRNVGITFARGEYTFLCDDDIEFGEDYIERLVAYLDSDKTSNAVTGLLLQSHEGQWLYEYPPQNWRQLWYLKVFKLGVSGKIHKVKTPKILKGWHKRIVNYFDSLNNGTTRAGWPVFSRLTDPVTRVSVCGLGTAMVRSNVLKENLYDEVLDPHGLGDNYAVCLGVGKISILNDLPVKHHRSPINRIDRDVAFFRRVLALHMYIKTKRAEPHVKTRFLLWSICGIVMNLIFKLKLRRCITATELIFRITFNLNPYLKGIKSNKKCIIINPIWKRK